MNSSTYSEDHGYVNIHGQDIKVFTCDKTGRILVPIDELRRMGFRLYQKSQYSKLLVEEKQFIHEFNLYMLEMAQEYMLSNKVMFTEEQVLESINKCKIALATGGKSNSSSPQSNFSQNHVIEKHQNGDISITTLSTEPVKSPLSAGNGFSRGRISSTSSNERKPDVGNQLHRIPSGENIDRKSNDSFGSQKKDSLESQNGRKFKNGPIELPEKIQSISFDKPEHQVVVSFVEKHNVYWVQDMERAGDLLDIDATIKKEITDSKFDSGKHYLNTIYYAQHEGDWCRCRIIKFRPLTAFFVDYGNTAEIAGVKEASSALSKVPGQAVKITLSGSHSQLEVYSTITIKIGKKFDNGSYLVELVSGNGDVNEPISSLPNSPPQPLKPLMSIPVIFSGKPPQFGRLEHDQRIMVVSHENGKMYLRTRESFDRLKQIEKLLDEMQLKAIDSVTKDQLVLIKNEKVKRAIVLNVSGNNVSVETLDYNEIIQVDLANVYHITESFAKEKLTYILSPRIKGYNSDCEEVLKDIIDNHVKGSVVLSADGFDLKLNNGLLSDIIQPKKSASSTLNRPMLKDFGVYKPPLGSNKLFFHYFKDRNNIYFALEELITQYVENIFKDEVPEQPYEPIVGEVCFGYYQDSWCRCVVIDVMTTRFKVQFIDFGNEDTVNASQLRKLTEDAKKVPVLGVCCKLLGLPRVDEDLLRASFNEGETFEVDICQFNGNSYDVNIPSLLQKF